MTTETQLTPEQQDRERRLQWFRAARFGMFIHWGLYAQLGRQEWAMNRERIPVEEYEKLADTWQPQPNAARAWVKLAKQAGMRYMVMTTKHHEGFCLFNSELTDYCAPKKGPGRDLVAEYVEAARAEGLRVGFYYSLMDWHHPDGARCKHDEAARRRFIDYIHGQVRELCTNYGKVDVMWYDVSWPLDAEGWESAKMNAMVRQLQPDILINNRSQLEEDFGTPEGHIIPEKGGRAWEACMTFYGSWGYANESYNPMNTFDVLVMLRQVAAGGGNLLLNIGPKADGSVPEPSRKALEGVGAWMDKYGASIYDAVTPFQQEWQHAGTFTRKDNTLYYHVHAWPGSDFSIGGLFCTVKSAKFMNGAPIRFTQKKDRLQFHGLPTQAPEIVTVIEMEVEGDIRQVLGAGCVLLEDDPWG